MINDASKRRLEILIEALVEQHIRNLKEGEDIVAQDPLIKIFITPFTDVIRTAKGELEKNVAITTSTIKNLAKQAAVLAIPFFAASEIKEIQERANRELEERLKQINSRYADVLKRNWDTVRGRDVWGITFMLDPSFGIAEKFILRAPYAALGVLEILTGGHPGVTKAKEQARKLVQHVTPSYLSSVGASATYGGGGGAWSGEYGGWGDFGGGFGESVSKKRLAISEQQTQAPQAQPQQVSAKLTPQQQAQIEAVKKQVAAMVQNLKASPAIKQALQQSPVVKELQAGALEAIISVMQPVLAARTYEQIKQAIGPEFTKYEQEYMKTIPEEIKQDPVRLKEFQQQMVPSLKEVYKSMMIQQLQRLSKQHPSIAKPMDHLIQQISKY